MSITIHKTQLQLVTLNLTEEKVENRLALNSIEKDFLNMTSIIQALRSTLINETS